MRRIATFLLCLSPLALCAQETAAPENVETTPEFVFEGDVDFVDPTLRSDIGPPRVLAGTLTLGTAWDHFTDGSYAQYQVVQKAEFTLDRNYVLACRGWQAEDENNRVTLIDGDKREKDDSVSFVIPMTGEVMDSGYVVVQLSILLTDEDGRMLESADPLVTAPVFKDAEFELLFFNPQTNQRAKATGEITMFANLEKTTTTEEYEQLAEQIRDLDDQLALKERLINDLRIRIDLKDREIKQRDLQIAQLEAANAELVQQNDQLRTGEAIQVMEKTNAKLLDKLEESQQAREFSAATVAQMTVRQEFLAKDNAELAQSNADLRDQLADALADISEMRNKQEMLARQAQVNFQQTLPPLPKPEEEMRANLPVATQSKPATNKAPAVVQPTPAAPAGSMMEMLMAAIQENESAQQAQPSQTPESKEATALSTPPGTLSNDRQPSGVITQENEGPWQFPLPMAATAASQNPAPSRGVAVRDAPSSMEQESDDRLIRRGPRR